MFKTTITYLFLILSLNLVSRDNIKPLSTVSSTTDNRIITFIVEYESVPIKNANVLLENYGNIYTDSLGKAVFEDIKAPDTLSYNVLADGYKSIQDQVIIDSIDLIKYINLELQNGKPTVKFFVAIGEVPVEGAKVTFHSYGTQTTNKEGFTTFTDVSSGLGLVYTVEIPNYTIIEGAVNVGNDDIIEEVIFAAPSYEVLFDIKLNDEPFEGVEITLGNYGTSYTNKYGYSRYLNVFGKNISYSIITERYGVVSGGVDVLDRDVTVLVEFTRINDYKTPSFAIYPNPTNSYFEFNSDKNGLVQIYTLTGKLIKSAPAHQGSNKIYVNDIDSGVYFLKLSTKNSIHSNKLVIE